MYLIVRYHDPKQKLQDIKQEQERSEAFIANFRVKKELSILPIGQLVCVDISYLF